jgi:hypothetical protein
MTQLLLRDLLKNNLQDDEIVIFFYDDEEAEIRYKEIFFKYDAKKVSVVKNLSNRKYDAIEKKWLSNNKLSIIKETLKDFNLKIVFCFDSMSRLVEYFDDDFYKANEDAFICYNMSVAKELKKDGTTMKDINEAGYKVVDYLSFEKSGNKQNFPILKRA